MARGPIIQPRRGILPEQAQADLRPNLLDRVIEKVAPSMAANRMQARANLVLWRMNSGQYQGAKTDRPNTRGWTPRAQSADDDVRGDQEPIRARARAADRDMPLARAIALTVRTGTVGIGVKAYPRLDARVLGLTDDQKDIYEAELRQAFDEDAESPWASHDGTMNHYEQQATAIVCMCVAGDMFGALRQRDAAPLPGLSRVAVQLIEGDLISTPTSELTNARFSDGVEYDANGVIQRFHIASRYPSAPTVGLPITWTPIDVWRQDNRPNCLHIVGDRRAGQARGVSDFAPILEVLKAISDLMDNELTSALVASLFTVFMGSADAPPVLDPDEGVAVDADGNYIDPELEDASTPRDVKGPPLKLGSGLVAYGLPNEKPQVIESSRPNPNFAPFFLALAQIAAAANNMPVSLVLKRFTSSYTAAQAEMIEAWRHFLVKRTQVVRRFSAPYREAVIADKVANGELQLPGFFTDPKKRRAWLACDWRGPTRGHMNPLQEAKALAVLADAGISSLEDVIAGFNGKSFEETHDQRKKEVRWRVADGLQAPVTIPNTAVQTGDDAPEDASADPSIDPAAPPAPDGEDTL